MRLATSLSYFVLHMKTPSGAALDPKAPDEFKNEKL